MKGFLIIFALCILGTYAIPKPVIQHQPMRGRVANGEVATNAPHACMVLVHRPALEGTGTAALGGGSIISARHCVTAAHLVQGNGNTFQVGFIVGTARRLVASTFAIIHQDYDNTNFAADLAIIFLQGTATFPLASAVIVGESETDPAPGVATTVVGFGFTSATSTGASQDPYAALQGVTNDCVNDNFEAAPTHFCAIDTATPATIVCPGDNGAGAFVADEAAGNTLVGIASRIVVGCAEAQMTGYTRVGTYAVWIKSLAGLNAASLNQNTIF